MNKEDHLAGEYPNSHLYQNILTILFFLTWIIDSFLLGFTTFLAKYFHIWIRGIIAIVLLLTSLYFIKKSNDELFMKTTEGLRVSGVYARVRHPMYLGAILLTLGITILTLSVATFIVWLIIVVFCEILATYEEQLLIERFDEDYITYKASVRKWIPI
jgi:protein-S-isoprenylcysteine O-methyltransferase Ste14